MLGSRSGIEPKMRLGRVPLVAAVACLLLGASLAQASYSDGGGDDDEDAPGRLDGNQLSETDAKGLPIYTTLNGSVTNLNEILPAIHLNRTKAYLNCSQGSMQVQLEFKEAFYGLAYADFDRNSACLTKGRGLNTAYIELPLKGCGTKQDPLRVFTNNIVVRFHPEFEIDGDEVITIVCRYPPAVALKPEPIYLPPAPPVPVTGPVLSPFHILLMICTLLFLALLLTGLGCSYICLRRRPVRILETSSEITKLSGSSALSRLSVFDNFQIPRVHGTQQQIYGSEAHLVVEPSDTLPSDYPSESHSEVEQRASSSLYSETINELMESSSRQMQMQMQMQAEEQAKFEVQMRVKQRAPAPPSPLPAPSDSESGSLALERNLTTILEREESSRLQSSFAYAPELHQPPQPHLSRQQTPPVYSRILRKQQRDESIETTSNEATHAKYRVATMLAPHASSFFEQQQQQQLVLEEEEEEEQQLVEEVEPLVEAVVASRRPEITTHEVDDVFLRTVTEKKTIEDIERHRRQVTEYRKHELEPKWDVTIRNYPSQQLAPASPPDWENFSDVSSASNLTLGLNQQQQQQHIEPAYSLRQPASSSSTPEQQERARALDGETRTTTTTSASWYKLERVLEPQYAGELSDDERTKWREIITSESTLRSLLTEAVLREDYELIRRDARYRSLFPPHKWDVIIRIISPPAAADREHDHASGLVAASSSVASSSSTSGNASGNKSGQRYKRAKSTPDWDNRSRRSSLPTLYEYESDGGASGFAQEQLLRQAPAGGATPAGARLRKLSSTTRGGSEADLRSMSEMTVRDFARLERDDQTSLSSYEGESLVRSLSQPSLARSGSEFTEHWTLPASRNLPNWAILDDEACSSADTTPRPPRRQLEHAAASGASLVQPLAISSSYSSHQQLRMQTSAAGQRPTSWFHDDSEPEMQI